MALTAQTALLGASALHLGFQAVVTCVVYPALAEVPRPTWTGAHAAHSRRIVAVVGPVYALLAAACGWALVAGPRTPALLLAAAGASLAGLVTALVAAPTHARLGRDGPAPRLLALLERADRVRLVGALVAVVGSLLAVSGWDAGG